MTTIHENKESIHKLTIEEQMQTSSIMAMQLEGLQDNVDKSRMEGHKFFTFESNYSMQ